MTKYKKLENFIFSFDCGMPCERCMVHPILHQPTGYFKTFFY
jgi:hypothetical protein